MHLFRDDVCKWRDAEISIAVCVRLRQYTNLARYVHDEVKDDENLEESRERPGEVVQYVALRGVSEGQVPRESRAVAQQASRGHRYPGHPFPFPFAAGFSFERGRIPGWRREQWRGEQVRPG